MRLLTRLLKCPLSPWQPEVIYRVYSIISLIRMLHWSITCAFARNLLIKNCSVHCHQAIIWGLNNWGTSIQKPVMQREQLVSNKGTMQSAHDKKWNECHWYSSVAVGPKILEREDEVISFITSPTLSHWNYNNFRYKSKHRITFSNLCAWI